MLNVARTETGEPEIFRSIQGEGPMAGRDRAFIRLSGCNLHCVWCDTAYTWNWLGTPFSHERDRPGAPHKFDPVREMTKLTPSEAARMILSHDAEGVVVTGGEPLMQASGVVALSDALRGAREVSIEIETNGSIAPDPELVRRVDLFVVSPKLAHSGNDPALAFRALPTWAALEKAAFKFVARDADDVADIATLAVSLGIAPERVYVMPEGTQSEALRRRGEMLAPYIARCGFQTSDRLHIHMFGEKRGV